jgi:hypothetical protein
MTSTTTDSGTDETVSPSHQSGRARRIGIFLLILLASVLLFGTAADVWVKRQVLSTPKWVAASDKILAEPKVQEALSTYIVDQIYSNVDVQQELSDKLPEGWKGVAGPLAAGIRTPAATAVEKILSSDQVLKIWHTVNEKAHQTLVNVLEDKTRVGSTKDGKVTLDIGEIVRIVGTDLGIPSSVMDKLPADVGQITIFESSSLASIQRAVKIVNILGPILFVVIVALYALAVWLARGRRRLTLRNVGWSIIVVGLLLTTMRRLTGNYIDSIITDPEYSVAGKIIFGILSELLFDTAWLLITWGAIIVAGMLVIGPNRVATWARRTAAPILNADRTVFWVGAAVLYLLVLLIVPSPALRLWWSVIIIGAVVALGLEYLRNRSLAEFPDVQLDVDVDGMKNSVAKTWTSLTSRFSSGDASDHVAQLQKLSEMHASGALSDAEYTAAKAKLLD